MAETKVGQLLESGRWWAVVFEPQWEKFHEWLKRSKGFVEVVSSELQDATSQSPRSEFVVFDVPVSNLVRWEGPGSATLDSTGQVTSIEEVEQSPEVADPIEELGEVLTFEPGTVKRTVTGLGIVGVVLAGIWAWRKAR